MMRNGKFNGSLFVFLSILIQLSSIFIFYGLFYAIARIFHDPTVQLHGDGMDFYYLTLMYVGIFVLFFTVIITIVREITKSELLASVMHIVALLFIWSSTKGDLHYRPYDYGLILFCISLTFPVRILFRSKFHSKNEVQSST